LSADFVVEASRKICSCVLDLYNERQSFFVYVSEENEVQTRELISSLLAL